MSAKMQKKWRRAFELGRQISQMQDELDQLKDELRKGISVAGVATVYKVRETEVSAYRRRGFTAVRMVNRKA